MDKPTAEFIGFQKDDRINGVVPYFVLHWSGSDRDGSNISLSTIRELEIEMPPVPIYEPKTFKDRWMPKCETCNITWFSTSPACDHIRANINHCIVSYKVPVAENIPFNQRPSEVWSRDKRTGELVIDGAKEIQEKIETTQPLNMETILDEDVNIEEPTVSDKAQELLDRVKEKKSSPIFEELNKELDEVVVPVSGGTKQILEDAEKRAVEDAEKEFHEVLSVKEETKVEEDVIDNGEWSPWAKEQAKRIGLPLADKRSN